MPLIYVLVFVSNLWIHIKFIIFIAGCVHNFSLLLPFIFPFFWLFVHDIFIQFRRLCADGFDWTQKTTTIWWKSLFNTKYEWKWSDVKIGLMNIENKKKKSFMWELYTESGEKKNFRSNEVHCYRQRIPQKAIEKPNGEKKFNICAKKKTTE